MTVDQENALLAAAFAALMAALVLLFVARLGGAS